LDARTLGTLEPFEPSEPLPLPRVLIIDDTPEIAELLTFALRERGYDVVSTGFTTSIADLVTDEHMDAVVLDCSVYDMSESLFDEIRGDSRLATLPVVVVTDTPDEAVASLRRRKAQRILLVPKPFTGAQVATALDQLLAPDEANSSS
jgi:DNA-binding response OmpR family regulator